jgi:hypothetical protein
MHSSTIADGPIAGVKNFAKFWFTQLFGLFNPLNSEPKHGTSGLKSPRFMLGKVNWMEKSTHLQKDVHLNSLANFMQSDALW